MIGAGMAIGQKTNKMIGKMAGGAGKMVGTVAMRVGKTKNGKSHGYQMFKNGKKCQVKNQSWNHNIGSQPRNMGIIPQPQERRVRVKACPQLIQIVRKKQQSAK